MPEPTAADLAALPVKDRLDLLNQQRQARHLTWNSVGILFGAVFTAASLIATALTLQATQEGQITDRYAKTVEQLGSDKREVRTAAVYALERIARDSARDRPAITDVLAAYARERDPKPAAEDDKLPSEPDTDVAAALTVLGRLPRPHAGLGIVPNALDLHAIRAPGSRLGAANLNGANLNGANLKAAELDRANLNGADLRDADLHEAGLVEAHLVGTYLIRADLRDANLVGANLDGAHLNDADLREANLSGADLFGADLHGADLRGAVGFTPTELKRMADIDETTRFS
ncbi:pentapeptide repeat-containing protein [Actinomadura sp. NPDC000600]|uniref:pentapeptide repeat-containing protein n=1 Tax=Actinomadura sp. NPDC000600 TaxID=3154262 RepID=UPI003394045A